MEAYAGKAHPGISGMFTAQKKEWSHTGFHSLLRVALPQINFLSPASLSENKKMPKDCHAASEKSSVLPDARTAPDTKYNHKQRMHPGPSLQGSTGTCGLRKAGRHIGYVLPLPVPHNRSRIKINYGFILAQYLVSCQLDNTISITFYLFQNIFKYFPARRVFLYITFSEHPDEVFRSLKTEEHTPSCIWVLMAGFLHRVCPVQMKSHTVQPVNAAGEGAGNGGGRVCVIFITCTYFNPMRFNIMNTKKKDLSTYGDFRKYSVEEISLMLGIGKTKTREMLQSHLLPVTKIGRDYFTSKTAIQEFLSDNVGKELFF